MLSSLAFVIMIIVLLLSVYCIHADTGSTSSNGDQRAESSTLQLQQLINQETMMRLTLDKQLQELRTAVYDLKSEVAQIDKISELDKDKLNILTNVSSNQGQFSRENDSPVYFTAFLRFSYTTKVSNEILKFNNVIVNEGGGYNSSTGKFTCPKSGAYLLSYGYRTHIAKGININMYINGRKIMHAYAPGDSAFNNAAGTSVHKLTKGDQVYVQVATSGARLSGDHSTSFSAVYIH